MQTSPDFPVLLQPWPTREDALREAVKEQVKEFTAELEELPEGHSGR